MKKIEKKTLYETSDGREFESELQAAKHEKLILARREYESARREFATHLASSFKTADGHDFEFGLWTNYYHIFKPAKSIPGLVRVEFWGREWDIVDCRGETDTLVLLSYVDGFGNANRQGVEYPINELYRYYENAEKALKKVQMKWLETMRAQIEGA